MRGRARRKQGDRWRLNVVESSYEILRSDCLQIVISVFHIIKLSLDSLYDSIIFCWSHLKT